VLSEGCVAGDGAIPDGRSLALAGDRTAQGKAKKKGATGITTVAPSVAGQWGRGDNRLPG